MMSPAHHRDVPIRLLLATFVLDLASRRPSGDSRHLRRDPAGAFPGTPHFTLDRGLVLIVVAGPAAAGRREPSMMCTTTVVPCCGSSFSKARLNLLASMR
ncbi:hypothetical protein [Lichenicola sp.]|uniref:hypothetical protein n=1 Tax=Lichenicola sp. TaxID=2804529 RepID=UPI003B008321